MTENKLKYLKQLLVRVGVVCLIAPTIISGQTVIKDAEVFDSGGQARSSAAFELTFQSIAPVSSYVTQSSDHQLVHGTHFSSQVTDISGYDEPYESEDVTFNAIVNSQFVKSVQFQIENESGEITNFSTAVDDDVTDDWGVIWDSTEDIVEEDIVYVRARGFDGLTYGKWFDVTQTFVVDNAFPEINNVAANPFIFSPNNSSSTGIDDDSTLTFDIDEPYLDEWSMTILDSANNIEEIFLSSDDERSISEVWDGLNSNDVFSDDGEYTISISVTDLLNHTTVTTSSIIVDNTSPSVHDLFLTTSGQALNSEKGDLAASWIGVDTFDSDLDYEVSFSQLDLTVKDIDGLVLWFDAADESSLIEGDNGELETWLDKSEEGNNLSQTNTQMQPQIIENTINEYATLRFDQVNDALSTQFELASQITDYTLIGFVKSDGAWTLTQESISITDDGTAHVGIDNTIGLLSYSDIGEILVFNTELTIDQESFLIDYLSYKWGLLDMDEWVVDSSSQSENTWSKLDQQDSTYYQVSIKATDEAGNNAVFYSNIFDTPDRTAPVIGDGLTVISGIEDVDFIFDPSDYKSDNTAADDEIYWDSALILSDDDSVRSSEEILEAINPVNNQLELELLLNQHANIESPVSDGNQFGKSEAWVTLTLFDAEGNYMQKDVELYIEPVNDAPEFITTFGDSIALDSYGSIIYNLKFDEDTVPDTLYLDDFIQDVDNLVSDLEWSLLDSTYEKNSEILSNGDRYTGDILIVDIGDETTNHSIDFVSGDDWYGDEYITIQAKDISEGVVTDDITIRVWPVNDAPVISSLMPNNFLTDEDTPLIIDFTAYEDDVAYEDRAPTYNNLLNWSVVDYDSSIIELIENEGSANDELTFSPILNEYGTANITIQLTDTDTVAESVFPPNSEYGGYVASPLSSTVTLDLVWYPINDAPEINTIADLEKDEDEGTWTLDLSAFKSDIEDSNENITFSISGSDELFTSTLNEQTNIITFTSNDNAWGTTTIQVDLTDSDNAIDFYPYTPSPLTTTLEFDVILNPINDAPSLESVTMISDRSGRTDIVMSTDILTVSAQGYSDIGYSQDSRQSNVLGDEYDSTREGELEASTNQKFYHYKWYADGEQIAYTEQTSNETDTQTLGSEHQGKNIIVEIWPDDGTDEGDVLTSSMVMNNLPNDIDQSSEYFTPLVNNYSNTENITLGWGLTQDIDDETIGYRYKIWKVEKWGSPPTDTSVEATDQYYDSDWFTSESSTHLAFDYELDHGTYYWKIWVGNEMISDLWDYEEPDSTLYFHIDLIDPTLSTLSDYIALDSIEDGDVIEDAGNTRRLYGEKPLDEDDDYSYQIILTWENSYTDSVVTGSEVIVAYTTSPNWGYTLTYPEGRTTYNIYLKDLAGNESILNSFVITDDTTPPIALEFDAVASQTLQDTVSSNYYYLSGKKEVDAAIYYEGLNLNTNEVERAQIVGFTQSDAFSLLIYPEKPSGNLITVDRKGNQQSEELTLDIEFIIGEPTIQITDVSRDIINAEENTQSLSDFGLSTSQIDDITHTTFSWSSNRYLDEYTLVNAEGVTLLEGNDIASNITVNMTVTGSIVTLDEGENILTLTGIDRAKNEFEEEVVITLKSEAPDTDIILYGSEIIMLGDDSNSRILQVFGEKLDNTVAFVNDEEVYVSDASSWTYLDREFDPETEDVTLTLIDEVYNAVKIKIWSKDYFDDYESIAEIELPISEIDGYSTEQSIVITYEDLPVNISGILAVYSPLSSRLSERSDASLGISDHSIHLLSDELSIPYELNNQKVSIIAKNNQGNVENNVNLEGYNVSISIPYPESYSIDSEDLVIIKFDETQSKWISNNHPSYIDQKRQRVYTVIDHTGEFGLAQLNASFGNHVSDVRVYPNPWIPNDNNADTGTQSGITFDDLTTTSTISIYTVVGEKVLQVTPLDDQWVWDGKNQSGNDVFSGVYLYLIKDENHTKTGKITIIK